MAITQWWFIVSIANNGCAAAGGEHHSRPRATASNQHPRSSQAPSKRAMIPDHHGPLLEHGNLARFFG
jgi:hypothetical protein